MLFMPRSVAPHSSLRQKKMDEYDIEYESTRFAIKFDFLLCLCELLLENAFEL